MWYITYKQSCLSVCVCVWKLRWTIGIIYNVIKQALHWFTGIAYGRYKQHYDILGLSANRDTTLIAAVNWMNWAAPHFQTHHWRDWNLAGRDHFFRQCFWVLSLNPWQTKVDRSSSWVHRLTVPSWDSITEKSRSNIIILSGNVTHYLAHFHPWNLSVPNLLKNSANVVPVLWAPPPHFFWCLPSLPIIVNSSSCFAAISAMCTLR